MLDIKFIRQNPKLVQEAIQKKQVRIEIGRLLDLDKRRRDLLGEVETLRAEQNQVTEKIAKLKGKEKDQLIEKMKSLKERLKSLEAELENVEQAFNKMMLLVPNLPAPDVKEGKDESENEVIRKWGEPPKFDFRPLDYMELGKKLDLIDTERAGKVSGTRFGYLKNEAVLLEFAIVQWVFDFLIKEGFAPIVPPVMIGERAMRAMGYLDRGADEIYQTKLDDLYLIGTSEQAIGPMHMDEIFEERDLPKRYAAFSTCFRREAGSYGKDTKGILRVHQFDKVEMFSFTRPEDSDNEHEYLLSLEEKMVQALELPYQVIKMCTGDLGDPAARKYDIECWIPSQNKYRETHSTSTCTDFQARRLNCRFRRAKDKKLEFVHTLNGTAFAIGRILIAILENYQQKDGSVKVPKVLQRYCGTKVIKAKK